MEKLIVFSHELDVINEVKLVNELFKEGMELFHLKKPLWDEDTQNAFIEQIDASFHIKISVHQHYDSIERFGLKHLHVREKDRIPGVRKKEGFINSTSFHSTVVLKREHANWDYCFLSPVFNSISKPGYNSGFEDGFRLESSLKNVFALGGITTANIRRVFEKGFAGAAVLGAVWHDNGNVIDNFKVLQEACNKSVLTY